MSSRIRIFCLLLIFQLFLLLPSRAQQGFLDDDDIDDPNTNKDRKAPIMTINPYYMKQQDSDDYEYDDDDDEDDDDEQYHFSRMGFGVTESEAFDNYGALLNDFNRNLGQVVYGTNKTVFVYFMHSSAVHRDTKIASLHDDAIVPAIKEMRGIINTVVFDCSNPKAKKMDADWLKTCKKDQNPLGLPLLQKLVPPKERYDPQTGNSVPSYLDVYKEVTYLNREKLIDWLKKDMTDYTVKIYGDDQFEYRVKNKDDKDINKAIFFIKKRQEYVDLWATAAEYRDRIRFYVIYVAEKEIHYSKFIVSVLKKYNVTSIPRLVVEQTYNSRKKQVIGKPKLIHYRSTRLTYDKMTNFLHKFARTKYKLDVADKVVQQQQDIDDDADFGDMEDKRVLEFVIHLDDGNFEKEIKDSDDGCLVYFTTLTPKQDVQMLEYRYFLQLATQLQGPIKFGKFSIQASDPNFKQLKKKYKVGKLKVGAPQFRYYPNQITGKKKIQKSNLIPVDLESDDFTQIYDAILGNFESNLIETTPWFMSSQIKQQTVDLGRHTLLYLHRGDQKVSLAYRQLSTHPVFDYDCSFISVRDPEYEKFPGLEPEMLPQIFILKASEIAPGARTKDKGGPPRSANGDQPYHAILGWMGSELNRTEEVIDSVAQTHIIYRQPRRFGEITSSETFQELCISHTRGLCAIGLLEANNESQYYKDKLNAQLKLLAELERETASVHQAVYYSWINVSCSPEWFQYFEFDPLELPTMLFYTPDQRLHMILEGKERFKKEHIRNQSDQFLQGKIPGRDTSIPHSEFQIEKKDCSLSVFETMPHDPLRPDQIKQIENLRRYEEERRLDEEEDAYIRERKMARKKEQKGKKGKKKKKNKAKKASSSDQDAKSEL